MLCLWNHLQIKGEENEAVLTSRKVDCHSREPERNQCSEDRVFSVFGSMTTVFI